MSRHFFDIPDDILAQSIYVYQYYTFGGMMFI